MLDSPELPQAHHGKLQHLPGKLDGDHPVPFLAPFPDMRDKRGDNHHIHPRKRLLTRADDVFPVGMEHQVDLILGVAVDRVVKLGVPVVKNDEQVVALHGSYFLTNVYHEDKNKKNSK